METFCGLVVIVCFMCFLFIVLAAITASESSTPERQTTEIKREIRRAKAEAMDQIDAATNEHKRQMFETVYRANQELSNELYRLAKEQAAEMLDSPFKEY